MNYLDIASIKFDKSKCINCARCLEVCPHQVFQMENGITLAHKDKCIECGACQMNCPTSAITVNAGTGCATAVFQEYLKNTKLLKRFF